jgi:hypothetical protein
MNLGYEQLINARQRAASRNIERINNTSNMLSTVAGLINQAAERRRALQTATLYNDATVQLRRSVDDYNRKWKEGMVKSDSPLSDTALQDYRKGLDQLLSQATWQTTLNSNPEAMQEFRARVYEPLRATTEEWAGGVLDAKTQRDWIKSTVSLANSQADSEDPNEKQTALGTVLSLRNVLDDKELEPLAQSVISRTVAPELFQFLDSHADENTVDDLLTNGVRLNIADDDPDGEGKKGYYDRINSLIAGLPRNYRDDLAKQWKTLESHRSAQSKKVAGETGAQATGDLDELRAQRGHITYLDVKGSEDWYDAVAKSNPAFTRFSEHWNSSEVFRPYYALAAAHENELNHPKNDDATKKAQEQAFNDFLGWLYSTPGLTYDKAMARLQDKQYGYMVAMGADNFGIAMDKIKKHNPDAVPQGIIDRIKAGQASASNKSGWSAAETGKMIQTILVTQDSYIKQGVTGDKLYEALEKEADRMIGAKVSDYAAARLSQNNGDWLGSEIKAIQQKPKPEQAAAMAKSPAVIELVQLSKNVSGQAINSSGYQMVKANLQVAIPPILDDVLPNLYPGVFTKGGQWEQMDAGGRFRWRIKVPAGTQYADHRNYVWITPEVQNGIIMPMVQDPAIDGDKGLMPISDIKAWLPKKQTATKTVPKGGAR